MNNLTRLPSDWDLPTELRDGPPSFESLVKHEPRGGPLDRLGAVVKEAASLPALPGASEANEHETYRQKLIAANRALDGQVVNELGKGAIEGVALAGLAIVATIFGVEVALVSGIAVVGVAIFGGRQ